MREQSPQARLGIRAGARAHQPARGRAVALAKAGARAGRTWAAAVQRRSPAGDGGRESFRWGELFSGLLEIEKFRILPTVSVVLYRAAL